MKHFPILESRCMVVELPEGSDRFAVFNDELPYLSYFVGAMTPRLYLPPGTWQIVGMLPEVTESEAAGIVLGSRKLKAFGFTASYETLYMDYAAIPTYNRFRSAIESLRSAINASGYTFSNHLGDQRPEHCYDVLWDAEGDDAVEEWDSAQSCVLSRERCLLLRRVE